MTRTLGSRQYRLDAMPHAVLTMTTTEKAVAWARIVVNYSLKTNSYDTLVVWPYGDFVFSPTFDIMSSTIKARRLGVHESMDTERMFINLSDYYRREKVIPYHIWRQPPGCTLKCVFWRLRRKK